MGRRMSFSKQIKRPLINIAKRFGGAGEPDCPSEIPFL
jgi:hypothetical protein